MHTLRPTSASEVADLRAAYLATLSAPIDGMWETFIGFADHWEIRRADERIGHFCLGEERRLLQFHVTAPYEHLARDLFAQAVERSNAGGALVSSFEPWLPLCLDGNRDVRVHSLLYHDHHRPEVPLVGFEELTFQTVEEPEREAVEGFVRRCSPSDPGEWLSGYLECLVAQRALLALRSGGALLGTGELRVSDSQPPYADLGVIVSPEHRGRGLAPHILRLLEERCDRARLVPICSTTTDNTSAQRAIAKAGFVDRHRLLEVLF